MHVGLCCNRFFRYTLIDLPMRYNLNFQYLEDSGLGPGGTQVAALCTWHLGLVFSDPSCDRAYSRACKGSALTLLC